MTTTHGDQASPQPVEAADRLLNKTELAERLGICRRSVENLMRQRRIPFVRLGGKLVRFDWAKVKEALVRYSVEAK